MPDTVSSTVLPVPVSSMMVPPDVAIVGASLVPVTVMVIGTMVNSLYGAKLLSTRARYVSVSVSPAARKSKALSAML